MIPYVWFRMVVLDLLRNCCLQVKRQKVPHRSGEHRQQWILKLTLRTNVSLFLLVVAVVVFVSITKTLHYFCKTGAELLLALPLIVASAR